ncbi:MAG: LysM peptidoglycan-binding domain-containing protein [Candidatus Omnitrophica bacterium]|nr:LysM peptidoglycan-binding domain-containing protein [Candidatus Omnitrophota bacterium]
MKKLCVVSYALCVVFSVAMLSGCVVRTYSLTRDRVDQDLTGGNRGYLKGQAPQVEGDRRQDRTTQVVEVEIGSPFKFERGKKVKVQEAKETEALKEPATGEGNQGYITQSVQPQIAEVAPFEKYTIQKNDTLQKISQKFYGTTKKWKKIFDANQDVLKSPNKLYPGQAINIPIERMSEPQENLK